MGDRDVALENLEVVIVSGMSGAGRTESMRVFEDLGYYCVDNLPPVLIGNLIDMYRAHGIEGKPGKLAFVCDARTGDFFEAMHTEPSTP